MASPKLETRKRNPRRMKEFHALLFLHIAFMYIHVLHAILLRTLSALSGSNYWLVAFSPSDCWTSKLATGFAPHDSESQFLVRCIAAPGVSPPASDECFRNPSVLGLL
ncbi:hypothetical protein CIRG_07366 [Coccidioides immitis RMSCC 2394]|uniref:Uncharacterized protein n=1 Tax=Coccidioides immitis RMSCC 2394 TaxID=404692 RepID=A0A0J6YJ72_COCIT|nr:hypothetical protein CIRG_07366 [Coccidioides immitis RMSCC 2394]